MQATHTLHNLTYKLESIVPLLLRFISYASMPSFMSATKIGRKHKHMSSQFVFPNMFRFRTFSGVTDMKKFWINKFATLNNQIEFLLEACALDMQVEFGPLYHS